jgi:hypothetical protein
MQLSMLPCWILEETLGVLHAARVIIPRSNRDLADRNPEDNWGGEMIRAMSLAGCLDLRFSPGK